MQLNWLKGLHQMMNKLVNLLTNTKFAIALILLSVLIIIFGMFLISASTSETDLPEFVQPVEPSADTSFSDSLQQTESFINANTQSMPSSSSNAEQLERG